MNVLTEAKVIFAYFLIKDFIPARADVLYDNGITATGAVTTNPATNEAIVYSAADKVRTTDDRDLVARLEPVRNVFIITGGEGSVTIGIEYSSLF